jgi:RNA polymerase sigma-70 factor (ECF subfamily)
MTEREILARCFEAERARLHAIAMRLLGSASDADDAVQEAWLRLERSDTTAIENLAAWLTTVVSRISLDMLRTPRHTREDSWQVEPWRDEPIDIEADPADLITQSDQVSVALLTLLELLSPAERIAFVLHDVFGQSFTEVAAVLDRSVDAARQLASRARRRLRGAEEPARPSRGQARHIIDAWLAAARDGDLAQLLSLLDDGAVLHADYGNSTQTITGARAIAAASSSIRSPGRTLDADSHRWSPRSRRHHEGPGRLDHGLRHRRRPDHWTQRSRRPGAPPGPRGRPGSVESSLTFGAILPACLSCNAQRLPRQRPRTFLCSEWRGCIAVQVVMTNAANPKKTSAIPMATPLTIPISVTFG